MAGGNLFYYSNDIIEELIIVTFFRKSVLHTMQLRTDFRHTSGPVLQSDHYINVVDKSVASLFRG